MLVCPQRELLPDPSQPDDPAAFDRSATITDYVRLAGATVATFEIDDVNERGRTLDEQWRASAEDMSARGRRVVPFDEIALPWDTLAGWLATGRQISQLAIDDDADAQSGHVACSPTLEFRGRISDWIDEVRKARDRGETTLFVAATPGRAERTLELLSELRFADDSSATRTISSGPPCSSRPASSRVASICPRPAS